MTSHTETTSETTRARALALIAQQGMLRLRDLTAAGIGPETVSRLVRGGWLLRVARGLYESSRARPSADHSLAQAAILVPRSVVCLLSALHRHRLIAEAPREIWLALPSGSWSPTIDYPPLRPVRFGPRAYAAGIETHRIEQVTVQCYGVAKTVTDCLRYRAVLGAPVVTKALREALRTQRCTVHELLAWAHAQRVIGPMRTWLEIAGLS